MKRVVPILLAAILAAAVSVALRDRPFGIERVWSALFGSPDLGPVDFTRLVRRDTPNDALACPTGLCGSAVPDIVTPAYDLPYHELRARMLAIIEGDEGAVRVAEATPGRGDRFVVRTPILRFPDTVDVMVFQVGGGRSTVALYSRSQIGRSDMGTNLARIRRWLDDPRLVAARVQP